MACAGCGAGINIDTDRLADATEEIRSATAKVPEITIKVLSPAHFRPGWA
jgi:hypothetical protein